MKKILLTLVALVSILSAGAETYSGETITTEGAWCWFADPRALHYESSDGATNVSWIGYIDTHGAIKAMQMDFTTGKKTEVLIRSFFQPDDHDNPTFLVLPSGRVMIFYTRHTDEAKFYYRISTKPYDITQLGAEKTISVSNNTTYPSPFIMSDDPEHIYLCWRGINWHPTIGRLTMPDESDNVKWDFGPKQIVQSTGARPYVKYQSNGKDKIYLVYTTGHPDNEYPNWVYFNVIDINSGNGPILKDIKGTTLKKISDGTFSVTKESNYKSSYPYTVVDAPSTYRDWVWQIARDADDNPVIAMVRIDNSKANHEYYCARWTGSAWRLTDLANAGRSFHGQNTELCYSAGMAIDEADPNQFYLSIPTEGDNGKIYEIWKYTLSDAGSITAKQQITKNSKKNNVRPYIVTNSENSPLRLAWMYGDYYYWYATYPTEIHCDYALPTFTGTLPAAVSSLSSASAFTITTNAQLTSSDYQFSVDAGNVKFGLDQSTKKLYITANSTTTYSTMQYLNSVQTSGNNFTSEIISSAYITLTYDGSRLMLYRNGLVELVVDAEGIAATTSTTDATLFDEALEPDAVRQLVQQEAVADIDIPSTVVTDIVLPTTLSDGSSAMWSSSDEDILTADGLVTLPETATEVTLTVNCNGEERTFTVTVEPRDVEANNRLVSYEFETSDEYTSGGTTYVKDKTGNNRDLAVYGNATIDGTLNLTSNTASTFSTNGYGVIPSGLIDGLRSYTVLLEATPKSLDSAPRFYDFGVNSANSLFFRAKNLSAGIKLNGGTTTMLNSSQQLSAETAYKLAVTFDAATKKTTIYIDGEAIASGTENQNEPYQLLSAGTDTRNYIGRTQWWDSSVKASNIDYIGTIDNFCVYNIALTDKEVAEAQGYEVHDGDSSLVVNYSDSVLNRDFEGSYSKYSAANVSSDRAIYQPENWTITYTNGNENDLSILNSGDLYANLCTAALNARTSAMGKNSYIVRHKWGTSTIQFSQTVADLPAAIYELSADTWYSGGTGSAVIFGNDEQTTLTAAQTEWTTSTVAFNINGYDDAKIGFSAKKLTSGTESFCGFDNFTLKDVTAMKQKKEILELLSEMIEAVEENGDTERKGIAAAYKQAKSTTEDDTWDDVYAAYVALRDGIANPDTPTAISESEVSTSATGKAYDLRGIPAKPRSSRIIIVDGKKYVH